MSSKLRWICESRLRRNESRRNRKRWACRKIYRWQRLANRHQMVVWKWRIFKRMLKSLRIRCKGLDWVETTLLPQKVKLTRIRLWWTYSPNKCNNRIVKETVKEANNRSKLLLEGSMRKQKVVNLRNRINLKRWSYRQSVREGQQDHKPWHPTVQELRLAWPTPSRWQDSSKLPTMLKRSLTRTRKMMK